MAFTTSDSSRFFGLDTRASRGAASRLLALPALRWLQPPVRVQLRHADGRTSGWAVTHGRALPASGPVGAAPVAAVELALDRVLDRSLVLPPLAPADLAQAVQLEVAAASPFMPDQTVHGFAAQPMVGGLQRVDVAITSRQEVEDVLRQAGADPAAPPEVWVLPARPLGDSGALRPVVLRGWGEGQRQRLARQGLLARLGLLLLALALLLLLKKKLLSTLSLLTLAPTKSTLLKKFVA